MWWWSSYEGDSLDEPTRERMEQSFGVEFDGVRIHRESALARAMAAEAFTSGRDIYFAPGRYGESVLRHELTHVVQQSRGGPRSDASHEHEAAGHGSHGITGAKAGAVQRQPMPGMPDLRLAMPFEIVTVDDFDTNEAMLEPQHKTVLDDVAASLASTLVTHPDTFVTITGHTDAVDTPTHNMELGQRRADAVLEYIAGKGIARSILRASSLGESMLAVQTEQPEKRNRRVDITIHKRSFFRPRLLDLTRPPVRWTMPQVPKPKIDLRLPPSAIPPEEPQHKKNVEIWKKAQEILERERRNPVPRRSAADLFGDAARDVAKAMGLPKWAQDRAAALGRKIPEAGAQAALDEIAAATGMDPQTKEALRTVIEALSQQQVK